MTDLADLPGWGGTDGEPAETDGRRLRRALNREAVVDALLSLYDEGNLRPGTDEIAERAGISPRSLFRYFDDTDDLAGEAVTRQLSRALPLVQLDVTAETPFPDRVAALVAQRLGLFGELGRAAQVARLRAPFQPRLAAVLASSRQFLRSQLRALFAPELTAMGDDRAEWALASSDVLLSFESYQLLTSDQGFSADDAATVLTGALSTLLATGGTP